MRVLWIGKAPEDEAAGDEVYDRKIVEALAAQGHVIERLSPARVSRRKEAANLMAGIPYYRARYASPSTLARLRKAAAEHDLTICSWEPFDRLAHDLDGAVIQILHNISSHSLPSMFPGNLPVGLIARHLARWERRAYGGQRFGALVALSRQDTAYGRTIAKPNVPVIYAPPGLPAVSPLEANARFRPEILLLGTYDWSVKRRDLLRFADDWRRNGMDMAVFSDHLPAAVNGVLRTRPLAAVNMGAALRLGIVTDRFEAGHKLKAGAYLAANAIVLSFANLSSEYAGLEDGAFFVRRIQTVGDITRTANELAAMAPEILWQRWLKFQSEAAETFQWSKSAAAIAVAMDELNLARKNEGLAAGGIIPATIDLGRDRLSVH